MAMFKTLSFCQKVLLWHQTFDAHVQCVYIVYAKHQMASVKTLVQVDFPVHALSEHSEDSDQTVYIVYAKHQMASVKTLVQVDFPVHALSEHKQNPY